MKFKNKIRLVAIISSFLILGIFSVYAEEKTPQLAKQIEDVKKEVLQLNRDLFILEEDLLFPANTQFSIFFSMDIGKLFDLDSVKLILDGKNVANHLYTEREVKALQKGGVQRLYIGNLASGEHELVAFFTGKGPNKRDYRRGTTVKFEKTTSPTYIELQVVDNLSKQQPEFKARVWEQ